MPSKSRNSHFCYPVISEWGLTTAHLHPPRFPAAALAVTLKLTRSYSGVNFKLRCSPYVLTAKLTFQEVSLLFFIYADHINISQLQWTCIVRLLDSILSSQSKPKTNLYALNLRRWKSFTLLKIFAQNQWVVSSKRCISR